MHVTDNPVDINERQQHRREAEDPTLIEIPETPVHSPEDLTSEEGDDSIIREQLGGGLLDVQDLTQPRELVIKRILRAAKLGAAHEAEIHYSQADDRWEGVSLNMRAYRGEFPEHADCSSFATWCYWDALGGRQAGYDLLNGTDWTWGYTGTMITHGTRLSSTEASAGDLAFYGASESHITHVAIVVEPDAVISHGQENGPRLYRPLAYRPDLQFVHRYL